MRLGLGFGDLLRKKKAQKERTKESKKHPAMHG